MGYLFSSTSWIRPTNQAKHKALHFDLVADGKQTNWEWQVFVTKGLKSEMGLCSISQASLKMGWAQAISQLRSETASLASGKSPPFILMVYLIPDSILLKKVDTSFSLDSIPLSFYFAVHLNPDPYHSCTISYPWGSPFAVMAHEVVHALADVGYLPPTRDLLTEETRAYLFDRLVACTLPHATLPNVGNMCCPLRFSTVSEPRKWLLESPDQLAQLVAAKVVRDKFDQGLCLSIGSKEISIYRSFVHEVILHPETLEEAAIEEKNKISARSQ